MPVAVPAASFQYVEAVHVWPVAAVALTILIEHPAGLATVVPLNR